MNQKNSTKLLSLLVVFAAVVISGSIIYSLSSIKSTYNTTYKNNKPVEKPSKDRNENTQKENNKEKNNVITDQDRLERALEVDIKKTINGTTYAFRSDKEFLPSIKFGTINNNGDFSLYKKDGNEFGRQIGGFASHKTEDFWFEEDTNTLFLVTKQGSYRAPETIYKIQLNLSESSYSDDASLVNNWEVLSSKKPGIYSGSNILSYNKENNYLLVKTFGGDGCGGWGSIWKQYEDGTVENITNISGGCNVENPRFGGVYDTKLILASAVEGEEKFINTYITDLYLLDLTTGEKEILVEDFSQFGEYDLQDKLSNYRRISTDKLEENEILLYERSDNENNWFAFNIETKEIRELDVEN